MAITYTWTIPTCEHDIATGGINVVHWRCTASETVGSADLTYTASLRHSGLTPDPSSPDFTPYADVTEAQAQGWVWDSVSQADTEAALASKIDAQKNPTEASGNSMGSRIMEMDALLNMVFAAVISGLGWWIKSQHDEIKRVTILLNRTREEMAKEYVTKADSSEVLSQIMNKFDRLEEKIDRLMER